MKKYKLLFLLFGILLLFILNASLQSQVFDAEVHGRNDREIACLNSLGLNFLNDEEPTRQQKHQCRLEGRGFIKEITSEGDLISTGSNQHQSYANNFTPAGFSANSIRSENQIHWGHRIATASAHPSGSGRQDIQIVEAGTGAGWPVEVISRFEVRGPTGRTWSGTGVYCGINLRVSEKSFSPPYTCVQNPSGRSAEGNTVVITETSIFMKRAYSRNYYTYSGETLGTWGKVYDGTVYRWDFN